MAEFKKTPGFGVHGSGLRFRGVKFDHDDVRDVKVLGSTFLVAVIPTALFGLAAAFLRTDPGFIRAIVIGLLSIITIFAWRRILGKEGLRLVRLRLNSGLSQYAVMHRQEAEYMASIMDEHARLFGRLAQNKERD